MRGSRCVALLAAAGLLLSLGPADALGSPPGRPERSAAPPGLSVTVVATGLDVPWDVEPLGDGELLVTERDRRRLTRVDGAGQTHTVALRGARIWSSGETGLMGLAVDRDVSRNGIFFTCSGWRSAGRRDIRVIRWRLADDRRSAAPVRTLVRGIPVSSGRHGGCRLLLTREGSLLVGTGDAARARLPQRRSSLGGKTLRIHPVTGAPWRTNRWFERRGRQRLVFTYGHRNVQGLAQRADGSLWSVEHGTDRDDEVNRLRPGRNYGWRPGPGYDESRPMTDRSLPGRQVPARWRSGRPTLATSGAAFVPQRGWGRFGGTLAVATLKTQRLLFIRFDRRGRLVRTWTRLPGVAGRLRDVTVDRDGSLLVTTSNGGGGAGGDQILRVRPVSG